MLLNRDAILNADDFEYEDVPCPEWGGTVRVKALTGEERDAFEQVLTDNRINKKPTKHVRARLLISAIIDEKGKPLFKLGDLELLSKKSAKPLDRLFDAVSRLSGITEKAVEEEEENFPNGPSENSTSN